MKEQMYINVIFSTILLTVNSGQLCVFTLVYGAFINNNRYERTTGMDNRKLCLTVLTTKFTYI